MVSVYLIFKRADANRPAFDEGIRAILSVLHSSLSSRCICTSAAAAPWITYLDSRLPSRVIEVVFFLPCNIIFVSFIRKYIETDCRQSTYE